MASFLVRAFGLPAAGPAGFGDTAGSVHEAKIDAIYAAGITAGCALDPLRYCPDTPVFAGADGEPAQAWSRYFRSGWCFPAGVGSPER